MFLGLLYNSPISPFSVWLTCRTYRKSNTLQVGSGPIIVVSHKFNGSVKKKTDAILSSGVKNSLKG
jgi:hypothetical protein